jgi:hypothetical protein
LHSFFPLLDAASIAMDESLDGLAPGMEMVSELSRIVSAELELTCCAAWYIVGL